MAERFLILSDGRTGSTYLTSLLRLHCDVRLIEEPLNKRGKPTDNAIEYVQYQLENKKCRLLGFKVTPEQLRLNNLTISEAVRSWRINFVIVLWRQCSLEAFVSYCIASRTGKWYSEQVPDKIEKLHVDVEVFSEYLESLNSDWKQVVSDWPVDVVPIFLKYEDLARDVTAEMQRILLRMSLDPENYVFETEMRRQNPASLTEKITNFNQLPSEIIKATLDVPGIVNDAILKSMNVPMEKMHVVPDREPSVPPNGWRYRVGEPYLPSSARENVLDAINSGSISSAGYWPKKLSMMLKDLFDVPVAQPCCNGFAALVLTLQAAKIGVDDEVIIPSFTMIAVVNAVRFVSAKPIPVDNAVNEYNPNIPEFLDAATDRTKAIIVTHTYGVPTTDIESLSKICTERGWFLIEDISECAGISVQTSRGEQLLGTFGEFACASMYANKLLQGADGGFVLAKRMQYSSRLESLVNHGFTRSYHFVHFEPSANFKMCGLAAAVACSNINSVTEILQHRSMLAESYRTELSEAPVKQMPRCGSHDTPWVFGIVCSSKEERQKLREHLAVNRIETRNYFFPIHLQPAYSYLSLLNECMPNAEYLAESGLYLPSFTGLTKCDIVYISSVIKQYFNVCTESISIPKELPNAITAQIVPDTLTVQVRQFSKSGVPMSSPVECSTLKSMINLICAFDRHLLYEKWDIGRKLVACFSKCCNESQRNVLREPKKLCQLLIDYIKSQDSFEQEVVVPWSVENLNSPEYDSCRSIRTTTDSATIEMLCWFVKTYPVDTIIEVGSWLGGCTSFMAVAARQASKHSHIFAVDSFIWTNWMNRFETKLRLQDGESFMQTFQRNTSHVAEFIQPVEWNIVFDPLPKELQSVQADIVFIDFTRETEELEIMWTKLKPTLIPNKSIVIINGLTSTSVAFVVHHKHELVPVAKPYETLCKAFRFVENNKIDNSNCLSESDSQCLTLTRKVKFLNIPDWNHHHRNSFQFTMKTLMDKFHSDEADVDFIPAVEEFLCDNKNAITRPWIGLIHGVQRDDVFYPPDLERLCTSRYDYAMKFCRGLFTLTKFQAKYLENNLPKHLRFPICPLQLPIMQSNDHASEIDNSLDQGEVIDLVFVGSFARDFELFYRLQVPATMRKVILAGDKSFMPEVKKASNDVIVQDRLDDVSYDKMLSKSIIFLALKYTGAANTIVVECIARCSPIVAPRMESCVEYLGEEYPLLYDEDSEDLNDLLNADNIKCAIKYLQTMNKSNLSIERFCNNFGSSSVLRCIAPHADKPTEKLLTKYDVTICLCSYKRTHHLTNILRSLLEEQSFKGSMQVIVWNNNDARKGEVRRICQPFLMNSTRSRSLEIISSTSNHYCIVRLCMTHLMQCDTLLICDDDIIPKANFVSFFLDAHVKHPNDVLCVRGHKFLSHELDHHDPCKVWRTYSDIRFIDDHENEQFIHFVHADACLLPKSAMQELCSIEMPDRGFILVDDYWMSFVLSNYFKRNLRKLKCSELDLVRTEDSEQPGLALYTRPEVRDAKIRMYIHHMMHGWPSWKCEQKSEATKIDNNLMADAREAKLNAWKKTFIGFNVQSNITEEDAVSLRNLGIHTVRIGAVGSKEITYEMSEFLVNPVGQLETLMNTISLLAKLGINVVLTLKRKLVSPEIWKLIVQKCRSFPNVIGYDVMNEPFLLEDKDLHFSEVPDYKPKESEKYFTTLKSLIHDIRSVDEVTPIIIEPTFWANYRALFRISDFAKSMNNQYENVIVSVHFYEPRRLTSRSQNNGQYGFPGPVPIYACSYSEEQMWDESRICGVFEEIARWQQLNEVKVIIGEFGIARETRGAAEYLAAVAETSLKHGISSFVYSFRENTWDAMDYELGPVLKSPISRKRIPREDNPLMNVLTKCIEKQNV